MKTSDLGELLLLAAIWGGSFLLMRIAAPEFGPFALIELRVGLAAVVLIPLCAMRSGLRQLFSRWVALTAVGLTASALPFVLYAWATLSVTAGFASIVNATTPIFTALVAWAWLKDKLGPATLVGMLVGMLGVVILVWGKVSFKPGGTGWAVAACLGATLSYGVAGCLTKRYLSGVPPLVTATGSQLYAAILLLPFAFAWWPQQSPAVAVWGAAALLAVVCSGLAYVLFFRLMASLGPTRAVTVTFLIPLFGMLWGALFLDEAITLSMIAGCGVILFGTALATGAVARRPPLPQRT